MKITIKPKNGYLYDVCMYDGYSRREYNSIPKMKD